MMNKINVKDAANYLITLYQQTNYQCDRPKLQKLVIFTDLLYFAVCGERLLDETVVTATEKGLAVAALSTPPYGVIFNHVNERNIIDMSKINGELVITLNPLYDYKFDALTYEIRNLLCYTFCQFGAYSGDDLTTLSRNTKLWRDTRQSDTLSNAPYVTTQLYKSFLDTILNAEVSQSAEEVRKTVVSHLKECLSSGTE